MKIHEIRSHIENFMGYVNGGDDIDLEKYYEIIDDFSSVLINNPPKALIDALKEK